MVAEGWAWPYGTSLLRASGDVFREYVGEYAFARSETADEDWDFVDVGGPGAYDAAAGGAGPLSGDGGTAAAPLLASAGARGRPELQ